MQNMLLTREGIFIFQSINRNNPLEKFAQILFIYSRGTRLSLDASSVTSN